jgi:uncharacterized OB-fold protein
MSAAKSASSPPSNDGPQVLGSYVRIGPDGRPSLWGCKCSHCGEVLLESRRACPRCATVGSLVPVPLASRGRVFSYTIVYRSFAEIPTPFISAVVALEGGGFIKGNLIGIEPDAASIPFDLPVRVEFEQLSAPGNPARQILRHVFVPEEQGLAARPGRAS